MLTLMEYNPQEKDEKKRFFEHWRYDYNTEAKSYNKGIEAKTQAEKAIHFFDKLEYIKRFTIPQRIMPRYDDRHGQVFKEERELMMASYANLIVAFLSEEAIKSYNDELAFRIANYKGWHDSRRQPINAIDYINQLPDELKRQPAIQAKIQEIKKASTKPSTILSPPPPIPSIAPSKTKKDLTDQAITLFKEIFQHSSLMSKIDQMLTVDADNQTLSINIQAFSKQRKETFISLLKSISENLVVEGNQIRVTQPFLTDFAAKAAKGDVTIDRMKLFISYQFATMAKPEQAPLFSVTPAPTLTPSKDMKDAIQVGKNANTVVETPTSFEAFKKDIEINKKNYGIADIKPIEKDLLELNCYKDAAKEQGSIKVYAQKVQSTGGVSLLVNTKQEDLKSAVDKACMLAVQTAKPGATLAIPDTLSNDLKKLAHESLKNALTISKRNDIIMRDIQVKPSIQKKLSN
ncbi:MAG: hypothetical protein JSS07_03010 [Proteobacteria bacterium]|nr:hypothetical protein [Pseudomonadota bacterium]